MQGRASENNDMARDTISASVVDLLVAGCRFDTHISGNQVSGPARTRYPPDVDRLVSEFPQRSASTNRSSFKSFGKSLTLPTRRKKDEEFM